MSLDDGRRFHTKVAGFFLFLPRYSISTCLGPSPRPRHPRPEAIPPIHASPLAALAPMLLGPPRVSHISDLCDDEGAAGLSHGSQCRCPRSPTRPTIPTRPNGPRPKTFQRHRYDRRALRAIFVEDQPLRPSRRPGSWLQNSRPVLRKSTGFRCADRALHAVMAFVGSSRPDTSDLLRHGHRACGRRLGFEPIVTEYWGRDLAPFSGPAAPSIRAATTHAGVEPGRRPRRSASSRFAARGPSLLARGSQLPRGPLATLSNHSGEGQASPGRVCRGMGQTRRLRRGPCGN